jgi:hypothetical protein
MPTERPEHEQTSGQRRGETKFGIDDGGCAVNIYGYRRKRGLNGSGRGEMVAGHDTIASGIVHKRQKGCRPRINSMEAVPETGNVGGLRPPFGENFACRRLEIAAAVMEMVADFGEQLDALLSGAAVGVSEHVTPVATALLRPTPHVAAMRAAAIDGACGPWSTAATSAASRRVAWRGSGGVPRSMSQMMSTRPALPISSWTECRATR